MSSQNDIICESCEGKHERRTNTEVTLKFLNNSQYVISDLLNEAKAYSIKVDEYNIPKIYGISQNPDTNDYIIVLDNNGVATAIWKNGLLKYDEKEIKYEREPNKEVILKCLNNSQNVISDLLIKAKAYSIKLNYEYDIPKIYGISQNPDTKDYIIVLNNSYCKECGKDGIATAIWKNGLLKYDEKEIKYEREPNKEVTLKCLNNSQNVISNLLNEAKAYSIKVDDIVYVDNIPKIYGISQNLNTNEYVIVFQDGYYCKNCAIWKDGPLKYDMELKRTTPNKEVALKCLYNSQNITNEFLNEVNAYSINFNDGILKIYGISQNPDTNDYIIVFEYASGGNLNNENNNIIRSYRWNEKLDVLSQIVKGLKNIHENKLAHRDFHTGNILVSIGYNSYYGYSGNSSHDIYISDMGLCGENFQKHDDSYNNCSVEITDFTEEQNEK
ncbi:kinase-like domain-containing protein [Rhizophagus irregularis DAOM 181602=DAOM 197198]|nr:kinase-like domain-containing protein [Rhizophagus irregularis DAOM 181602=DAOM 197198]